MGFSARCGRFFGPWFAFATLSGLASSLAWILFLTGLGLIVALLSLVQGETIKDIVTAAPDYARTILALATISFEGGFFAALTVALVGGRVGMWWGVLSSVGFICLVAPAYLSGDDPISPILMTLSAFGSRFPLDYLRYEGDRYNWEKSARRYFRSSWLLHPPQPLRGLGLIMPLVIYGVWQFAVVLPEFSKHKHYLVVVNLSDLL